jgi:hypothetical protein
MNSRIALIVIGAAVSGLALIPYAYKPRCASVDCPMEAPYIGERGSR